jgi:hypothetical protein
MELTLLFPKKYYGPAINLPITVFDNSAIKMAVAGARRIHGKREKNKAEPLSKKQLEEITSPALDVSGNECEDDLDRPTCTLSSK